MTLSAFADVPQWRRINALLEEALALPAEERQSWLKSLPAEHLELLPMVRSLLARAAVTSDGFLRRPVDARVVAAISGGGGGTAASVGQRVGPYRLVRELGTGGMGTVWLADPVEGALQRQVALKLPHYGWAPGVAQRLEQERDALAVLENPHIARLYDAGVTETGRPYLVMEFVDGVRIDVFASERQLSTRARIELFQQVTAAVAYAHERFIVHRDLKPSNILVTLQGEVRLLDFGAAKLLGADGEQDSALTREVGRALSPDYASPEQVGGGLITVASDVYSLGVVLFELLTGARPYTLTRHSTGGLEAALMATDVPLPSSVVSDDRRLSRQLRGDLDNIIAKALKKPVSERYGGVQDFADDLQRWLRHEPVTARPDSVAYRLGKFVRRNRAAGSFVFIIAALTATIAYFVIDKFWISRHERTLQPVASIALEPPPRARRPAIPAPFAPPRNSIAVLPFVNLSGDASQQYFSDGLTEELLNSLARINELQVAARTSAFSFRGKDASIGTIARELNVAALLEGSVRRSGSTVRVTTQLIDTATGFRLWSQSYDRDLGDVLKLQTEIADAVSAALKVELLGNVTAKIELGGTHVPAAFDAYLRASKSLHTFHDGQDLQRAAAYYSQAIRLDRNYALAIAGRSLATGGYATEFAVGEDRQRSFARAQADARQAIALTPELAEGHLALALVFENGSLDFSKANEEYERALAVAPGNALVLRPYANFARSMGRADVGLAAARRTTVLDPLNPRSHVALGWQLLYARRFQEAIAAFQDSIALDSNGPIPYAYRGFAYYLLGDLQSARNSCEIKRDFWLSQVCLALTYDKLGRHADARAVVVKLRASEGDNDAYQYAGIYAQWHDTTRALDWLETALRLRDAGLADMRTDPLMDPLRQEPRFQAIEHELKFPN